MKVGTKVKWITSKGVHGSGFVASEQDPFNLGDSGDGHVCVVVDAEPGEEHRLIYCALTWLTET